MEIFEVRPADADTSWGDALSHFFRNLSDAEEYAEKLAQLNDRSYHITCRNERDDTVPCSVPGCKEEAWSKTPAKYPYCRGCHYSGAAERDMRDGQFDYFATRL